MNKKLEKILDRYAIRSLDQQVNDNVLTLTRRYFKDNRKKRLVALKYFNEARRNAAIVHENLREFVRSYRNLESEDAKRECDKRALELISSIFCNSLNNVLLLYKYYTRMKNNPELYEN